MALVCLCHGVSERKIRKVVAHGATSVDEIGVACRAGTTCHGCHDTLDALLDEASGDVPVLTPRRALIA